MRTVPTEGDTQKAILELLAAESIFAFRINTRTFDGEHKGKRWFMSCHSLGAGCADILALPDEYSDFEPRHQVVPTWFEVKAPGKKQSQEQINFQKHVESLGHRYLLIESIDQVIQWVKDLRV